jgi:phenylacetate-coenzyme A ligase PaaK-like adenylate-forming protein
MPFLRYRLNDLVTRGPTPCPCGNPTATLQAIRGRTNDWLSLPDGRRLHPFVVSEALMKCVPGIRRLQVVQSSERELTILIVPGEPLPAADLEEAQSKIAASIDHCLGITIRQVEHLEAAPNRKFNPFVPLSEKPGSQKPTRAAGV